MDPKLLREFIRRQDDSGLGGPYSDGDGTYAYGDDGWWWSSDGLATRYIVVIVIFSVLLVYFAGGYWHARHRVRKGLPPMVYHRWMLQRRGPDQQRFYQPAPGYEYQQPYHGGPQPEMYPMYGYYRPPPPAYSGADGPPPNYQAPPGPPLPPLPEGASKIMADQGFFPSQPQQHQAGSSVVTSPEATASGARQREYGPGGT